MKLATFNHAGTTRVGVVRGDEVVDLATAAPSLPRDLTAFLAEGSAALTTAREVAASARARLALAAVRLEAPILRPPKFLAIGLNYADHVKESRLEAPPFPVFFNKQSTCVTGTGRPIHVPRVSALLDYEGELAFVIGRRCRHVPRARAREVIAGFLIVNDVSVRDWQFRAPTMMMGKGFDTHGPLGPWIVTPDEIGDPHDLEIRCFVNGEKRQETNTQHMIFDCFQQIEHLTAAFTLEPGDVISTGTSSGVGIAMKPPKLLQVGDVVRIEINKIGHIENRVIPEPDSTSSF
jgi:2-keto-4-pentenoate hydratase/2-oxohepta-3-ene-1,7-dioic acid hydratase in catechol pathway